MLASWLCAHTCVHTLAACVLRADSTKCSQTKCRQTENFKIGLEIEDYR